MAQRRRWFRGLLALTIVFGVVAGYASGRDTWRHARANGNDHATPSPTTPVATFSIVAFDPDTGDLGIAVQSKFFGVGAVVPWARAGVGAIATQSYANTSYGPDGLTALEGGADAATVVNGLTAADDGRALRQLGIVDAQGRPATFTGDACLAWAGGRTGDHYAAQGNILTGPEVVDAMAAAFEAAAGDLATRLTLALAAGQAAGGDARGRQSAALLVVRAGGGYGGHNDRYIDLRVDDHQTPIVELRRLLSIRHAQLASAAAGRLLREGRHDEALRQAERAVELDAATGSYWLELAQIRLALGDDAEAAEAGTEALARDPWLKTAVLSGVLPKGLIERLLEDDGFARAWESIVVDPGP